MLLTSPGYLILHQLFSAFKVLPDIDSDFTIYPPKSKLIDQHAILDTQH